MARDLNPDFEDLIRFLTARSVEFIVVGAHALAFHGIARYTEDLDLWIRRSSDNAEKVRLALADFGIELDEQAVAMLRVERKVLRFGVAPSRVEILNFLDGCEFESAFARAPHESLAESDVAVLGLQDYIATKKASGRPKDLSDLTLLRDMLGVLPDDSAQC